MAPLLVLVALLCHLTHGMRMDSAAWSEAAERAEVAAAAAAESTANATAQSKEDAKTRARFAATYGAKQFLGAGRDEAAMVGADEAMFQPQCVQEGDLPAVQPYKPSGNVHLLFITLSYKNNPKEHLGGTFADTQHYMSNLWEYGLFGKAKSCVILSDGFKCKLYMALCHWLKTKCTIESHNDVTAAIIQSSIQKFSSRLSGGDMGILQYCGHGVRLPDETNPNELDGQTEALAGTNSGPARFVRDEWLYDNLVAKVPAGAYVFSIFDSCHSADVLNLPWHYNSKLAQWCWMWNSPINDPSKSTLEGTRKRALPQGYSTLMAGTQEDELAADLGELKGGALSADLFGTFFEGFLKTATLNADESLHAKMTKLAANTPAAQHPQVSVTHPFSPEAIFRPLRGPFSKAIKTGKGVAFSGKGGGASGKGKGDP